jgi:hypothetical protein
MRQAHPIPSRFDWLMRASAPVGRNPETGRFFITFGQAGFNSPANNRDGYRSAGAAQRSIRLYEAKGRKARGEA